MPEGQPLVWTLTTDKAGDRRQINTLAAALGWPVLEKRLTFNPLYRISNLVLGASLRSLSLKASDSLGPPWPSLIIASGRRTVPVARWIRRQSDRQTKLVHIGRPWAPLKFFDLIISTPQYHLMNRPNVLINTTTLNRPDEADLAAAAERWRPRLADQARPLIAVLVGGNSKPLALNAATARELGRRASAMAADLGGSLAVTTSPRSSGTAVDALLDALPADSFRHRFGNGDDNPYLGLLALADRFIVTGDSASMLTEACYTGKPVHLFPLPVTEMKILEMAERVQRFCLGADGQGQGLLARGYRLLINSLRDMNAFNQTLIDNGLAEPLDRTTAPSSSAPIPRVSPERGLNEALMRIRALFPDTDSPAPPPDPELDVDVAPKLGQVV
ncbi:MAG: mitochondrial fission ELM1 family protein [Geminicoccaceae bacterium]